MPEVSVAALSVDDIETLLCGGYCDAGRVKGEGRSRCGGPGVFEDDGWLCEFM